jgi:hypothetical protein
MVRTHEPGEANFRSILPEDIEWKPFPAFPPEARLAVLVGEPDKPGPYVIRVKVPPGVKLMPHKHPEDRIYTVMSCTCMLFTLFTYPPAEATGQPSSGPGARAFLGYRPLHQENDWHEREHNHGEHPKAVEIGEGRRLLVAKICEHLQGQLA